MKLHHAYEGTLNEVKGVWSDEHPEGVIVEREFLFITADDKDHELKNKETEETRHSVVIESAEEQENWEEIENEGFPIKPKKEEEDA